MNGSPWQNCIFQESELDPVKRYLKDRPTKTGQQRQYKTACTDAIEEAISETSFRRIWGAFTQNII